MSSIGLPSMLVRRAAKLGCSSNCTALCSAAKSASVMVPSNCGDIDQGSLYGPWDIGPQASKSFASLTNAPRGGLFR